MGTRYKTLFFDTQGEVEWTVRLIDTDYVGVELDAKLEGEGFKIEHGERGKPVSTAIVGSQCIVYLVVESSEIEGFVDDIANEQEGRFFIRIDKNGTLFWIGAILQDQVRVKFSPYPFTVELTATDGLATLKNRREPFTSYDSVLRTIIECLDHLDPEGFFLSDEPFVRTSVRWFETQTWTGAAPNDLNSLSHARLPSELSTSYTIDSEGDSTYKSWFDWLEGVLTAFGARILLWEGVWWVVQLYELSHPSLSRYNDYSKDYALIAGAPPAVGLGGFISGGTLWTNFLNLDTTGGAAYNRITQGGEFGFDAALNDYRLKFDFDQGGYLGWGFVRSPSVEIASGTISAGISMGLNFYVSWLQWTATVAGFYQIAPRVRVRVRLEGSTDYYLQQTSVGGWNWVTTVQEIEILSGYATYAVNLAVGDIAFQDFKYGSTFLNPILCAPAPVSGTLRIQFTVNTLDPSGAPITGLTLSPIATTAGVPYDRRGVFYSSYFHDAQGFSSIEFIAENNTITTSTATQEEVPTTFVGDAPFINSNNRIEVYSISGNWVPSDVWRVRGTGSSRQLLQTNVATFMNLTDTPKRLYDLPYRGDYFPQKTIRFNGVYHLINYIELSARSAMVDAEVLELVDSNGTPTLDQNRGLAQSSEGFTGSGKVGQPIGAGNINVSPSGATTSIAVLPLPRSLGVAGQYVEIVSPSGISRQTVRLASDAMVGNTSILIDSTTFAADEFPVGSTMTMAVSENIINEAPTSWRGLPAKVLLLPEGFRGVPSAVTSWVDVSGEGNDFTATGAVKLGSFNGRVLAETSSMGYFFLSSISGIEQPFSLAFALSSFSSSITLFVDDYLTPNVTVEVSGATIFVNAGINEVLTFAPNFKVIQIEINGASSRARVDGQPWQSMNPGTNAFSKVDRLFFGNTKTAAACLYNYTLTDAEWDVIRVGLSTFV